MTYPYQYHYCCYPPCPPYYCQPYSCPYPYTRNGGMSSSSSNLCSARQELEQSMCAHVEACQGFLSSARNMTGKGRTFNQEYREFSSCKDYGEFVGSARRLMSEMPSPDFSKMVNPIDDTACWTNLDQDLERELAPTNHMRPTDPPPSPPKCYYIPPQTLSCHSSQSES